jgi:hypothetical protein
VLQLGEHQGSKPMNRRWSPQAASTAIRVGSGSGGGWTMTRMFAIVLLAAGILALVYGGFSYTKQTHEAKVGPLEINITEDKHVNVPVWAGVALAIVGGGLLVSGKK